MQNFARGFESSIFSVLAGAAGATGGGTRTHTVRVSNRGTIDRLIQLVRSEHERANRHAAEVEDLRAQLAAANRAVNILANRVAR